MAQRKTPSLPRPSDGSAATSIVIDGAFDDWRTVPLWTRFSLVVSIAAAPLTVSATDDSRFWYLSVTLRDSTVVSAMPGTIHLLIDADVGGYLGSPNDALRLLQARTMRRYVLDAIGQRTPRAPVVIAGDYNSVASYKSVRTLQQSLDRDGSELSLNRVLRLDGRTASTWRNDSVAQFTPGRLDLAMFSDREFGQTGGFVFAAEDLSDCLLASLQITRDMSRKSSDHLIVVTDLRRKPR